MKKFTLIMSLFIGLSSLFSCKDKDEPILDFKLSQSELSLIVGQSQDLKIESGNAPYTIKADEHFSAEIKGKVLTVKALKCDANALKATPVVLMLTDKANKKQEVKLNIYNKLDISMQDVKLYEGQTADVRINAGKLDAFKLSVKDESIATAKIASEMIGEVELKKILVTAKAKGETELTVTDGLSTKTVKIIIKEVKPITLWGAINGELKQVDNYIIKAGEEYGFVIKGGTGKYIFDYDKEQLIVGEAMEHGDDYIVKVGISKELTKSQDVKFKVSQDGNADNAIEITIKADVPKQAFSCKVLSLGKTLTPSKDKDGDDVYEVKAGEELTIKLIGGTGDYYVKKSTGDELIAFGAVADDLKAGDVQWGENKYPSYLIPSGMIHIKNTKANTEFGDNLLVTKIIAGGTVSKDSKWITIKVK